jgi:phosphatidylinositol 4-phosphatase
MTMSRVQTAGQALTGLSAGLKPAEETTTFAAFKMLPIDPTRSRRTSSIGGERDYIEPENDILLNGATNCKQAVEYVVDYLKKACEEIGSSHVDFVKDADVVR